MHKVDIKMYVKPSVKPQSKNTHPVAVVGARGYSGLELARCILAHPQMHLAACFSREPGWHLSQVLGEEEALSIPHFAFDELLPRSNDFHTIFLALPAEASLETVRALQESKAHIIDLSGAFRLEEKDFKTFYKTEHTAKKILPGAVYGLQPWCRQDLKKAQVIANPGCYATSVLMALLPLLKDGLIETGTLVIDAKSGATGAGRAAKENLLFCEVDGNCLPYKVGKHQHLPEIIRYAELFAQAKIDPFFSTHLLPVRRGIVSGIYARTNASEADVLAGLQKHYEDYPLVRAKILDARTPESFLALSQVAGTARTHIGFNITDGKLYLFSCIDNLLKGAASQAIENWNALVGNHPTHGLMQKEGLL